MKTLSYRQLQDAVVLYVVTVEVPDGLTPEEEEEIAEEAFDDGDYEVTYGPEVHDLGEIISQTRMDVASLG